MSTPTELLNAAKCFCFSPGSSNAIKTYLLSQPVNSGPCVNPTSPNNVTVNPLLSPPPLISGTLVVSWDQPANSGSLIISYTVQLGTVSGGPYTSSQTLGAGIRDALFTGLALGTTYYAVVTANGFGGCSTTSSEASGTTQACTTGSTVTTDWANRVVINGGAAPSAATQSAISSFVCGCETDGIWSKMIAINIFAPDNLIASRTPLLKGPGSDPWVDLGGSFVNADLSVNGLTGNAPTPKVLKTGVNPSTAFSSSTDAGWAVYDYNVTATGFNIGAYDGTKCFMGASKHSDNNAYGYNGAALANVVAVATSGNGYYADIRVSSTDHKLYFANSLNPHAQIGATDAAASTGTLPNAGVDGCFVFAENFIGSGTQFPCSDTISAVAFFEGFTAADSANLFARLQALRTAFGGGWR